MTDTSPEFLPLTEYPVDRTDSIRAGCYLLQLEADHGPLHETEIFTVLTGADKRSVLTSTQRKIIRQVSQVIGSEIPRSVTYYPDRVLSILEHSQLVSS